MRTIQQAELSLVSSSLNSQSVSRTAPLRRIDNFAVGAVCLLLGEITLVTCEVHEPVTDGKPILLALNIHIHDVPDPGCFFMWN